MKDLRLTKCLRCGLVYATRTTQHEGCPGCLAGIRRQQLTTQSNYRREAAQQIGQRWTGGLTRNASALARIAKVLAAGHPVDACVAVLKRYRDEAIAKRKMKHFNGETNWVLKNFERSLGMVGSPIESRSDGKQVGHYQHTGDEEYAGGEVKL